MCSKRVLAGFESLAAARLNQSVKRMEMLVGAFLNATTILAACSSGTCEPNGKCLSLAIYALAGVTFEARRGSHAALHHHTFI